MAGRNNQTWNRHNIFAPPQPPHSVVKMAHTLIDILGEDGYHAWCDQSIAEIDKWAEIAAKMEDKLISLDYHIAHTDNIPA